MKSGKQGLSIIFSLCSVVIVCPIILYSMAKAQEQSACYVVDPSGQVRDLKNLCSQSSQGQESGTIVSAEEFYRRASEFDRQGKSQEAIAEYTRAIELDPNYAEAYIFRGNVLVIEGQPLKGIEDAEKAVAIYNSRGDSQRASMVLQFIEMIRQGIEEDEF